jgi:RND family efflux transporter MFP subunit
MSSNCYVYLQSFERRARLAAVALGAAAISLIIAGCTDSATPQAGTAAARQPASDGATREAGVKPALTVAAITPRTSEWPRVLTANGNVAAWQEAVISTEVSNLRLTDVKVNVGDRVQKGQVLARIASDTVDAERAQAKASVAEAEAMLSEARANGDRARQYQKTGFLSAQQINQYLTAEKTAVARLNAARARLRSEQLRLAQTIVRAPDDGVISARTATIGSLAQPGQELFRLIRGNRLEWRAEVSAADLASLKPGMAATLTAPRGERVQGRVRMVAPTVDPQTLNGLVYVDLPVAATDDGLRAGMFARGEFELGRAAAMSLPQTAVVLREGFNYVFLLDSVSGNAQASVRQTKVVVGLRKGDRIEILQGLASGARVVASGAGFLADGDVVRVLAAPTAVSRNP